MMGTTLSARVLFLAAATAFSLTSVSADTLGPISEETPPATCDPGSFVESVSCTGNRCDNVAITCQSRPGVATGRAVWTQWFSEEHGGRGSCPAKYFVAGLACQMGYCDNVSLYCVELPNAPATSSCTDTKFTGGGQNKVTVLDSPAFDKSGQKFLASGLTCKGSSCSQLSMCVREQ